MGSSTPSAALVATADDTTGALEVAAACADLGWSAVVTGRAAEPGARRDDTAAHRLHVVDLRCRHLAADEAAAAVRSVLERAHRTGRSLRAHKIDSTLRGNWPSEIAALATAGRRVLVVPAFPAAGRTCVDGTVLVDGVPVHETAFGRDPRTPVLSSRPLDQFQRIDVLSALGGAMPARDATAARSAFGRGACVVVADAAADADVAALAAYAGEVPEFVLAGPAAVITALARHLAPGVDPRPRVPVRAPVLVVSASRHPVALAQVGRLAGRADVLQPPPDANPDDADRVLAELAAAAHRRLDADPAIATLVVVGGDTAAAVIGDAVVTVDGTLGVGIAAGTVELRGRTLRLVTKPGGFGAADTLVDVLQEAW